MIRKTFRRARRIKRRTRRAAGLAATIAALAAVLGGCAMFQPDNGRIEEVETGRNGVKVEVIDGDGAYEAYLIPDTECEPDDYIQECADKDDYLVPADGAIPGLNRDRQDGDD